jgi:hypothetical protein
VIFLAFDGEGNGIATSINGVIEVFHQPGVRGSQRDATWL